MKTGDSKDVIFAAASLKSSQLIAASWRVVHLRYVSFAYRYIM